MRVEENIPLARVTTFRIGGPARYIVTLSDAHELDAAVLFARERKLPVIPLGDGSNLLAPDKGVEAAFIRLLAHAIRPLDYADGAVTVSVDAGCSWDSFVARASGEGWWGIENLSGIPGTVGAAAVQNIGAYGAALEETLVSVDAFDLRMSRAVAFSRAQCSFGYRTSIFKEERDRYFVTALTFRLSAKSAPRLSYKDIAAHFAESREEPTLSNIRRAVLDIREKKFPPLATYGTAGSFFLNPVVSTKEARKIQSRFAGMPLFPMPEGGVKVPLAWILDRVLQLNGFRVGGVFLWDAQPLVIAADAGATALDVMKLAELVREKVKSHTGVEILPEVRIFAE